MVIDKYTPIDAASGMLLALRGRPVTTAFAFGVALELGGRLMGFGPAPGREAHRGWDQATVNIIALLLGWTVGRVVMENSAMRVYLPNASASHAAGNPAKEVLFGSAVSLLLR